MDVCFRYAKEIPLFVRNDRRAGNDSEEIPRSARNDRALGMTVKRFLALLGMTGTEEILHFASLHSE